MHTFYVGNQKMLVFAIFFIGFFLNQADLVDSSNSAANKIYDGHQVASHSFPFEARVITIHPNFKYLCGGSLISTRFVVTSARCVISKAKKVNVILGAHNMSDPNESGRRIVKSEQIIVHDNFTEEDFSNDIALITLEEKITLDEYVSSVRIASGDDDYAGHIGTVIGWGLKAVLRKFDVGIIANEACESVMSGHVDIKETNLCTFSNGVTGACNGDSGGSLILNAENEPLLIGVLSSGMINCSLGKTLLFTRITSFYQWIEEIVEEREADRELSRSFIIIANNWLLVMLLFFK